MRVLLFSSLLFTLGTLSFLRGFLSLTPLFTRAGEVKSASNEPRQKHKSDEGNPLQKCLEREGAPFDNLVFVLIDALRSDNVFPVEEGGSPMPFVQECVERGKAMGFISHGQPPTVTLPRIKALTSGFAPGFADVILNFFAAESKDASFVGNMKNAGKKLVFYGDDTWLKLFPHKFSRFDGTTSFFVNDYTVVDDNVTRHLKAELEKRDWDALILHYLGLDHIGHTTGPHSPLVKPKLEEMDSVIRQLSEGVSLLDAVSGQSTLIVVTGDHGMSNLGSHGGSSKEEIQSPLIFIADRFKASVKDSFPVKMTPLRHLQQIDVASTVSYLMGVPAPEGSRGIGIPEVITASSSPLCSIAIFTDNLRHICPSLDCDAEAKPLSFRFDSILNDVDGDSTIIKGRLLNNVVDTLGRIQAAYLGASSQYQLTPMVAGAICQTIVLLGLLCSKTKGITPGESSSYFLPVVVVILSFCLILFVSLSPWGLSSSRFIWSQASFLEGALILLLVLGLFVVYDLSYLLPRPKPPNKRTSSPTMKSTNRDEEITVSSNLVSSSTCPPTTASSPYEAYIAIACLLIHAISLASSSFVEEEHYTWYFLVNGCISVHFTRNLIHSFATKPSSSFSSPSAVDPNAALNSSFEIAYSWENGGSLTQTAHEDLDKGRGVYRRGKGVVSVLNTSGDSNLSNDSLMDSHISDGGGGSAFHLSSGPFSSSVFGLMKTCFWLLLLIPFRVIKSWNPLGLKWNHLPTISTWLNSTDFPNVFGCLVISSIISVCFIIVHVRKEPILVQFIMFLGGMFVYAIRSSSFLPLPESVALVLDPTTSSRIVFLLILLLFLLLLYPSSNGPSFVSPISLLTLLLARLHNIPLVALHLVASQSAAYVISNSSISSHPYFVVFFFYSSSQLAFFSQGTSNSLASIDVSASTIGLTAHHPFLSGILLILATYSLPLLWLVTLFETGYKQEERNAAGAKKDNDLLEQANRIRRDESLVAKAASNAYEDPRKLLDSLKTLKKDIHALRMMQKDNETNNVVRKTTNSPNKSSHSFIPQFLRYLLICRMLPLTFFSIVIFIQRYHLFIWSVFAPKLLFEAMNFTVVTVFSVVVSAFYYLPRWVGM